MLVLLQCARSLRLGSNAARQPAASKQEGELPLHGGLCASAGASSATKQQQPQAPDAGLAQPYGNVFQDCYSTHVAAGDSSQPVPCKAANAEPWLTLQVCRCQQRHACPQGYRRHMCALIVVMACGVQVLTWDLLMDISGGAARAVAHAVHAKLGYCARPHQQSAATAVPRLFEPFAILANTASSMAAGNPAPGAGCPSDEALHCCYAWQPPGDSPDSRQAAPLLAAAWTNTRSSFLAVRLLGGGSGAAVPAHPPAGMHTGVTRFPGVPHVCLPGGNHVSAAQGGACGRGAPMWMADPWAHQLAA